LEELIVKFFKVLLIECESEYNTLILSVKKQDGMECRLVYPVVANPYTLLTSLKEKHKWFTVLDLKDAFFWILLDKDSQVIFAFEWESPTTRCKTWMVLPQGFRNIPTPFSSWQRS